MDVHDRELATLRRAYPPPWRFERVTERGHPRIRATRNGYSVTGDNAGQVGRAIVEWMSSTGLTGGSRHDGLFRRGART
jgi:hypothetical protein